MTGDQARQCVEIARATIEEWKAKLLPVAGQGVVISDRQVTLLPVAAAPEVRARPTFTLELWAQVTMTQQFNGEEPPGYEDATFEYEPRLAKQVHSFTTDEYEWPETTGFVLPEIIVDDPQAGEFLPGKVWSGLYDPDGGPTITNLVKTASVTWYLLLHKTGQEVTFATGQFAGRRTLTVQTRADPDLTGDITSPRTLLMSRTGTVDTVTALTGSGGDNDTAQVYELVSISSN